MVELPRGDRSCLLLRAEEQAQVQWLAAHGGSGVSTLRAATGLGGEASRSSLVGDWDGEFVVVVARTHARGLLRAQELAAEAAEAGLVLGGEACAGLVLVADAPGRMPKPLAELAQLVSGGYRKTWRVPFVEAWRLGDPPDARNTPKVVSRIGRDIAALPRDLDLRADRFRSNPTLGREIHDHS